MAQLRIIVLYAGAAAIAGTVAGIGTIPEGRLAASRAVGAAIAATGMRRRPPQAGDYWSGCNDARAAGTAPIYRGEPGYRDGMDGDGDGIACEPHRGI